MENIILGQDLERRQESQLVTDPNSPGAGGTVAVSSLPIVVAPGATGPTSVNLPPISTPTLAPTTTQTTTITSTAPALEPTATNSSAPASSGTLPTTTLIAILVPICVLLAAVPTAAYLMYLRRRDKKRDAAEMLRGRGAGSSSGATGEALLMRRSMSATSGHERKFASVSSTELEMGVGGAALEKSLTNSSHRQNSNIFAPVGHDPSGRRSPPDSILTHPKPGFKPPPVASQSPTLPPLDFGKDDTTFTPLTSTNMPSHQGSSSPPKSSVPATLPTFAPTQHKQRAPAPALAPGRSAAPSPVPADNPSWPLPAGGLRDSASTYSSTVNDRPSVNQNKPLPSALNREVPHTAAPSAAARQLQTQQQHGPRESSIAYGIPPVPPSPEADHSFMGDRRSNVSRKRDSDAVSELSYSASTRGRRDTRRDTDAISIVSALSQNDR